METTPIATETLQKVRIYHRKYDIDIFLIQKWPWPHDHNLTNCFFIYKHNVCKHNEAHISKKRA